MEDHELKNSGPPRIWDNTLKQTFVECPRKFYYFLRRFTYSSETMPVYFTWGRAFHQAMLTWHTSTASDPNHRLALAIGDAQALWRDEGGIDQPPHNTIKNLTDKLMRYVEEYGPTEEWSFIPKGGEAGWIYPLNSTYELAGAMDGYVEWPGRGIFVLEHKSTGEYLIPRYRESFHMSTQVTGYVWYLHKLLKREDIFGALINMVTKNIKGPRSKWKYPEFDREHVQKLPWHLEQFEEDFIVVLDQFEKCWNDWKWPTLGLSLYGNCCGGPGKAPCVFRGICSTPVSPEEVDIRRYVGLIETEEEWKPWEREGDA